MPSQALSMPNFRELTRWQSAPHGDHNIMARKLRLVPSAATSAISRAIYYVLNAPEAHKSGQPSVVDFPTCKLTPRPVPDARYHIINGGNESRARGKGGWRSTDSLSVFWGLIRPHGPQRFRGYTLACGILVALLEFCPRIGSIVSQVVGQFFESADSLRSGL